RKAFGDAYVDAMIRRNQHLFLWRSITDAGLTAGGGAAATAVPAACSAFGRRPGGRPVVRAARVPAGAAAPATGAGGPLRVAAARRAQRPAGDGAGQRRHGRTP